MIVHYFMNFLQCAVFGALMRPLTVEVAVKEEQEEDESLVLRLPDGSEVHTGSVEQDGGQLSLAEGQSPSHTRLPLPTITEQVRAMSSNSSVMVKDCYPGSRRRESGE